jgi:hypothetical protein
LAQPFFVLAFRREHRSPFVVQFEKSFGERALVCFPIILTDQKCYVIQTFVEKRGEFFVNSLFGWREYFRDFGDVVANWEQTVVFAAQVRGFFLEREFFDLFIPFFRKLSEVTILSDNGQLVPFVFGGLRQFLKYIDVFSLENKQSAF